MPVVGTAGHVDHGKSTLTQALSGRDPDRWAEEKERGLTIDLGFAWTDLDGQEVSFVDVPGHERYSKNMLAGIESIDVALLVVAADEGWMPQSEEHLAVLDLLEVPSAVVALTKIDRVDDEMVELATLEVEDRLAGTGLAGAPIVPVSAATGTGLTTLRNALRDAVSTVEQHRSDRPRMWIDRVFSAQGAGTVVTGTLLGGSVAVEDRVEIFPLGLTARVRGIQSHEQAIDRVDPQRRVALNLGGVGAEALERGTMVGRPSQWRTTRRVAVSLNTARYVSELTNRGAYHLHVGSGAWPVRLRLVEHDTALIDLPSPLPLAMGDRFILRDTGRRLVVAGGRVLDPVPPRVSRLRPRLAELVAAVGADPDSRAAALLRARGRDKLANLAMDSGGGTITGGVVAGSIVMTSAEADATGAELERIVEMFHREHPLRPGLSSAEAVSRLQLEPDALLVLVARTDGLEIDGSHVRSRSFAGVRSDEQEAAWRRVKSQLEEAGAGGVPRIDDLEIGLELIHALARAGELVRISDEFVLLPSQVELLLATLRSFAEPFTVSEFRDRSGLSRKYAVPFSGVV
jgi:selenocysteine-specific elongation factor